MKASSKIGDRSTSDVVVRLRTHEGRDDWIYCHSHILVKKSKYFEDRLSENCPTCQILDSRSCVEVYCQESDLGHNVNFLRILYVIDGLMDDVWHGVRNALGILRVAVDLGCPQIIAASVNYLEAVPWGEVEEEEILRIIPGMGSQAQPILARVQPVDPSAILEVFLSSIRFATSSPPPPMDDLKTSAQEQLEYMITKDDDDAPLITADDEIKSEVKQCVKQVFARFNNLLESLSCEPLESISEVGKLQSFKSYLFDLSWACQMLTKLEIMEEFVNFWVDVSDMLVKTVEIINQTTNMLSSKVKLIEVTVKVFEPIGYGTVILATAKRLHMVKVWLPFVRVVYPLMNYIVDGESWQSLESTFVSIILALPSGDQAGILTEWLGNKHIQYPDLTEAFEVWSYRSKVAKRRLQDGFGDVSDTL